TPVTVTTWGTFQLAGVKVSDAVETVPSLVFELLIGIVTLADGCNPSTTVNVALAPDSEVNSPVVGATRIGTRSENSEGSPNGSVAVAVGTSPGAVAAARSVSKLALPDASVVTPSEPR